MLQVSNTWQLRSQTVYFYGCFIFWASMFTFLVRALIHNPDRADWSISGILACPCNFRQYTWMLILPAMMQQIILVKESLITEIDGIVSTFACFLLFHYKTDTNNNMHSLGVIMLSVTMFKYIWTQWFYFVETLFFLSPILVSSVVIMAAFRKSYDGLHEEYRKRADTCLICFAQCMIIFTTQTLSLRNVRYSSVIMNCTVNHLLFLSFMLNILLIVYKSQGGIFTKTEMTKQNVKWRCETGGAPFWSDDEHEENPQGETRDDKEYH